MTDAGTASLTTGYEVTTGNSTEMQLLDFMRYLIPTLQKLRSKLTTTKLAAGRGAVPFKKSGSKLQRRRYSVRCRVFQGACGEWFAICMIEVGDPNEGPQSRRDSASDDAKFC